MKISTLKTVLALTVMSAASLVYSCGGKPGESPGPVLESVICAEEGGMDSPPAEGVLRPAEEESTEERVFVHVCGAVREPGVYVLDSGSRIADAVEAAGGFTENADDSRLNLAAVLQDGIQIYVPEKGEDLSLRDLSAGTDGSERVNINTADVRELTDLRGIGEARAADIISFRETHGPFQCIEEIMLVPGIKTAAFEKIRENITVE